MADKMTVEQALEQLSTLSNAAAELGLDTHIDDEAITVLREAAGEFGAGIQHNPKARYWQERADFWRGQALLLGYAPEVGAIVDAAIKEAGK